MPDPLSRDRPRGRAVLWASLVVGAGVRLWLATLGHNFDLESWRIVGLLVDEGRNAYAATDRLPYGPVWALISAGAVRAQRLLGATDMVSFHLLVAGVLAASDLGIAWLLARRWDAVAGIVFVLCPASFLVSGFHSQVDTLAVLFALGSWCILEARDTLRPREIVAAGVLLGLSLATKHLALFLPLWLLFWPRHPWRTRIACGAIAYAVFLCAFVPFVLTPEGRAGVLDHVFRYRGLAWYGNGLLPRLGAPEGSWTPLFIAAMALTGFFAARRAAKDMFPLYLVALVAFSPTIVEQYLAIPVAAVAMHWRRWAAWPYAIVASVLLAGARSNVGMLPAMHHVAAWLGERQFLLAPDARSTLLPQLCLVVLLASWVSSTGIGPRAPVTRRYPPERLFALGALTGAVGFTLCAIRAEFLVRAAPLNDEVMHLLLVRATNAAIGLGQDPTDFWLPGIGLGYPLSHHYQHLAYVLTALVARVSGATFGASDAAVLDACRTLLIALFPLSVYWGGRRFGFERPVAACAALASAFVSTDGMFGFDVGSYVWRGYGLYTQLFGMVLMPPAVAQAHHALRTGRGHVAGAALLAATLLCHLVSGYVACATVVFLWLAIAPEVGADARPRTRLVHRVTGLALLFALVALFTAYFFVPFFRDSAYLARSVWEDRSKYDAYGAAVTLQKLVGGELFDFGRLPVLTLALGAGLAACLRRVREAKSRVPLVIFGAWLLLYFGRPTWGRLVDLLPGSGDLHLHRFILGVHLGGLYLIGHGMALAWRRIGEARRLRDWALPVAVTLAFLAPAAKERLAYTDLNTEWKTRSAERHAAEQSDLDAMYATLRAQPPGRVYAGLAAGWGQTYRIGDLPMFGLLAQDGFDVVGRLYHALSLAGDVQVRFEETRRAHFELFNVRYVLSDASTRVPSAFRRLGAFGRHNLSALDTGGYFAVVRPDLTFTGTASEFHAAAEAWLQSPLANDGRHPRVFLNAGDTPAGALPLRSAPEMLRAAMPAAEAPRGRVVSETVGSGSYAARVRMERHGLLMLKVGYHPGWRTLVGDRPVATSMLLPGYVGVAVPPGEHVVRFRYRASGTRHALQALAVAVLVLAFVTRLRARRTGRPPPGLSNALSASGGDVATRPDGARAAPAPELAGGLSAPVAAPYPSPSAGAGAGAHRVAITLALTFVGFYAAVGPGNFFSIDEVDIQETAQALVQRGTLDIPAASMTRRGRGNAHYDVHRGPALAFVAMPAVALGNRLDDAFGSVSGGPATGPPLGIEDHMLRWGGRLAIFTALFVNACLGGALVGLLFLFALRFGGDRRAAAVFATLAGLATPLFSEATHFFQHPLETLGLLCALWFFGAREGHHVASGPLPRGAVVDALLGGFALALAMLARPNAAAGAVPLWLYGLVVAWRATTDPSAGPIMARVNGKFMTLTGAMSLGPALAVIGTMTFHWMRFGSEASFGFPAQGEAFTLDPAHVGRFVAAYLASPALSVFLFAPPLLFALASAPTFARRWPLHAFAVWGVVAGYALLYASFGRWDGGIAYGPRYMCAPITLLLLFAVPVIVRLMRRDGPTERERRRDRAWRAVLIATAVLGFVVQGLGVLVYVTVNQWALERLGLPEGAQVFHASLSPPWLHLQALVRGEHLAPWALRAFAAPGPALAWWTLLAAAIGTGAYRVFATVRGSDAPDATAPTEARANPAAQGPAALVVGLCALVALGFAIARPLRVDPTEHARRLASEAQDAERAERAVHASELRALVTSLRRWSGARP
jgi:hypothetical protein